MLSFDRDPQSCHRGAYAGDRVDGGSVAVESGGAASVGAHASLKGVLCVHQQDTIDHNPGRGGRPRGSV